MALELPDFDALWNFGKPVETEAAFRGVLAEVEGVADEAYVGELWTQIARTLGLQRRFDEAHAVLDTLSSSAAGASRLRVRYLLERGRIFNSSGHKAASVPLFVEAWELGRSLGEDGLAVDAAHMVAIAEEGERALEWNLTAMALATSSSAPSARKWLNSLHNNIGWTYFSMGRYELALHHFELSREAAAEAGNLESERIARWCIAKTYRVLGRVAEALAMQEEQLAELEAAGRSGPFVYEELGECLYALGRTDEAAPFFARAYELLSQDPWLMESEPARVERLGRLALGG